MQKLCCVRTRQHSLPVWIISSQVHHHISTNSQPFSAGIVSFHFWVIYMTNAVNSLSHGWLILKLEEFPILIKYYTNIDNGTLLKEEYTTIKEYTLLKDVRNFMYLTQPYFMEDTPNQIIHILSTLLLWSKFLHYYWSIPNPL